jgi:hypothetical protein
MEVNTVIYGKEHAGRGALIIPGAGVSANGTTPAAHPRPAGCIEGGVWIPR